MPPYRTITSNEEPIDREEIERTLFINSVTQRLSFIAARFSEAFRAFVLINLAKFSTIR